MPPTLSYMNFFPYLCTPKRPPSRVHLHPPDALLPLFRILLFGSPLIIVIYSYKFCAVKKKKNEKKIEFKKKLKTLHQRVTHRFCLSKKNSLVVCCSKYVYMSYSFWILNGNFLIYMICSLWILKLFVLDVVCGRKRISKFEWWMKFIFWYMNHSFSIKPSFLFTLYALN